MTTDPHQDLRKLATHIRKSGMQTGICLFLTDAPKQTTCNHFRDKFLWVNMSNKRLLLASRRTAKGQPEWELGTETEEQKGTKSINETDIHIPPAPIPARSSVAVINAVYPGLWRPPDNGPVICFCSLLKHLRATIIVLSVWTGEISVRSLV